MALYFFSVDCEDRVIVGPIQTAYESRIWFCSLRPLNLFKFFDVLEIVKDVIHIS